MGNEQCFLKMRGTTNLTNQREEFNHRIHGIMNAKRGVGTSSSTTQSFIFFICIDLCHLWLKKS